MKILIGDVLGHDLPVDAVVICPDVLRHCWGDRKVHTYVDLHQGSGGVVAKGGVVVVVEVRYLDQCARALRIVHGAGEVIVLNSGRIIDDVMSWWVLLGNGSKAAFRKRYTVGYWTDTGYHQTGVIQSMVEELERDVQPCQAGNGVVHVPLPIENAKSPCVVRKSKRIENLNQAKRPLYNGVGTDIARCKIVPVLDFIQLRRDQGYRRILVLISHLDMSKAIEDYYGCRGVWPSMRETRVTARVNRFRERGGVLVSHVKCGQGIPHDCLIVAGADWSGGNWWVSHHCSVLSGHASQDQRVVDLILAEASLDGQSNDHDRD